MHVLNKKMSIPEDDYFSIQRVMAPNIMLQGAFGHGMYGTVYHAHDTDRQKPVVVKISKATDEAEIEIRLYRAFRRERPAFICESLADVDVIGYRLIIMRAYTSNLFAHATTETRLADWRYVRVMRQMVRALEFVHTLKIAHIRAVYYCHLDLHAGNILLDDVGNAHLCDFGVAKMFYEYTDEEQLMCPHGGVSWADRRQPPAASGRHPKLDHTAHTSAQTTSGGAAFLYGSRRGDVVSLLYTVLAVMTDVECDGHPFVCAPRDKRKVACHLYNPVSFRGKLQFVCGKNGYTDMLEMLMGDYTAFSANVPYAELVRRLDFMLVRL